ncbi:GH32 C-terminal domain-containing protein [Halalkalibacter flavus]|uniref:GH32 C-terminal domain-containing protein n=1 Tax=Halalkalibacter flavus TaxID=3090668 RepID=UPI002FC86C46
MSHFLCKVASFTDEIFINGGEKVMTSRLYPGQASTGIKFFAQGIALIKSLKKWNLRKSIGFETAQNVDCTNV